MRAREAGVACCCQLSVGRQVGSGAETRTNFPLACGSQRTNSVLSAKRGRMMVEATRSFLRVPGLHASIVPSRVRTRGVRRSMCEWPRRQPRQVPTGSRRPATPHCSYSPSTQRLAASWCGVPVRRGPMASKNTWALAASCELSVPRR